MREEKGKHGKFDPLWYGPYKITEVRSNNTFMLENLDGEVVEQLVNGQFETLFPALKITGSSFVHIRFSSLYIFHQASYDSMLEVKALIYRFLLFHGKKHYPQVEPDVVDHLQYPFIFKFENTKKIENG